MLLPRPWTIQHPRPVSTFTTEFLAAIRFEEFPHMRCVRKHVTSGSGQESQYPSLLLKEPSRAYPSLACLQLGAYSDIAKPSITWLCWLWSKENKLLRAGLPVTHSMVAR